MKVIIQNLNNLKNKITLDDVLSVDVEQQCQPKHTLHLGNIWYLYYEHAFNVVETSKGNYRITQR